MLKRFSMWLDLRAQAQDEPSLRVVLQVPTDLGHRHRIACKRHRDAGTQFDAGGVFGGQGQRQERVVIELGGPAAVVAATFQHAGTGRHLCELADNGRVYLEAAFSTHAK